jgi:translation elongation factor EF-G
MLEPIMHVDVRVPNEYTGDLMSDLNRVYDQIADQAAAASA